MTSALKRQPIPFGKYLLLDRVNIGGMAEVWRAKTFGAGGFERLVAIKRILPNIAEDEEFISMFIDEAKITVQLSHANIAQIYELSHLANSYFISMEYVSGKDMRALFDRCRKRGEPAPIPLVCYVVAKCCEGLDYAHRAKDRQGHDMNIVHRDVSPQNVLVSYEGEVKVIDFGIAKAAGKATKTQAGILKGKFGYMSPEQIRGLPLDRRSDIFAIGVCLYEMLTGERLFVGDSDFSVLEKVRKVEVLPPSHFNRKIPEALEQIVMRALAKDIDDRFQYASELAMELQGFMYGTGARFGQRELSQFMKATFAEDHDKERGRLQEYADIRAPEGMALAAEAGFGIGPLPEAPGGGLANPSAVTALPTMVPPGAPPVSGGLPPLVRPVRADSAETNPVSPAAPALERTASSVNVPRLTAVAPILTNEKDEHQATVLVDGDAPFAEDGGLARRGAPASGGAATDPAHPRTVSTQIPRARTSDHLQAGASGSSAPTLAMVPEDGFGPTRPTLTPARPPFSSTPSQSAPQPYGGRMAPVKVADASSSPGGWLQDNRGLVLGLAAVVALLIVGVVGVVLLKPAPKGLVMVVVPEEVVGRARLNINGEELTEVDGSPLKVWPQMRQVPVGSATVMVTAPGYEPLIETVQVRRDSPATLEGALKKKD